LYVSFVELFSKLRRDNDLTCSEVYPGESEASFSCEL